MNVLSLFDGMSCGQIALKRIGAKVDKYYASEIDKYAIQIAQKNFPNTTQLGDVTTINAKDLQIDLLIGGSPCQGFSLAGKKLNFEDPRSKLFFEFVRILKECNPKYFLLENVKMKKESQDIISKFLGVEPIEINSSLVSAQNRRRLYWTNIPFEGLPKDKNIKLVDILENNDFLHFFSYTDFNLSDKANNRCATNHRSRAFKDEQVKSGTLMANQFKQPTDGLYAVADLVTNQGRNLYKADIEKSHCLMARDYKGFGNQAMTGIRKVGMATNINGHDILKRVYSVEGKSPTLNSCSGGNREPKIAITEKQWRKLTPLECERLQTVDDNYTEGVSNTQRYKMLGNGWTVDVIAHIFKSITTKGVLYERNHKQVSSEVVSKSV